MFHRFRAPSGEERPWTLREVVQGHPLRHPSHPMFVHFPVAFYIGVLVLDLLTRAGPDPALVYAGTLLLVGAFVATAFAVTTGLVDWFQMVRGSKKRRTATRHMLFQSATAACFVLAFALRWGDRRAAVASWAWIVPEGIGVLLLLVGQYLGGILVYQMAMRVRTTTGADRS